MGVMGLQRFTVAARLLQLSVVTHLSNSAHTTTTTATTTTSPHRPTHDLTRNQKVHQPRPASPLSCSCN